MNTTARITAAVGLAGLVGWGCTAPRRAAETGGTAPPPARSAEFVIFDFPANGAARGWQVEDDVVMGGRSRGAFGVNPRGNGVFSGEVSLENNGGFSSVQYFFGPVDIRGYTTAVIRLKGDGRNYRFLVEATEKAGHYYVHEFQTSGAWQTVEIPLRGMYPERRGDRLDIPDFPAETLAQIRFLIANGKAESFRLEVERVALK